MLTPWQSFLHTFATCFTAPSRRLFDHLLTAWVLCPGHHTLTRLWSVMPAEERHSYGAYARFIRLGRWAMVNLWEDLLHHLLANLVPEGVITILLDDTLIHKSGRKIEGSGWFRDAVRSSARQVVLSRGLNIVVMSLRILPLWGGEPLALPILVSLHRKGAATLIELAAEMVFQLESWLPQRSFLLVADGAYAPLLRHHFPRTAVITRLRRDAALYALAPQRRPGQLGRPRLKGERLPNPSQIAALASDWCRSQLRLRDQVVERRLISRHLLWYQTSSSRPLRLVVVRDPHGLQHDDFFISSDTSINPSDIATAYYDRWPIEVCFRDIKQSLGAQDPHSWVGQGPQRIASLACFTYSAVWSCFLQRYPHGLLSNWPHRPWYTHKNTPAFADALAALRYDLWSSRVFANSHPQPLTPENASDFLYVLALAA